MSLNTNLRRMAAFKWSVCWEKEVAQGCVQWPLASVRRKHHGHSKPARPELSKVLICFSPNNQPPTHPPSLCLKLFLKGILFILLFFVYSWFVCIYVLHHGGVWCLCWSEAHTGFPASGTTAGWEPPCGCWQQSLGSLQEHQVFFLTMPDVFGGQKESLDSLDLKIQMLMSHKVGARNQTSVFCKCS